MHPLAPVDRVGARADSDAAAHACPHAWVSPCVCVQVYAHTSIRTTTLIYLARVALAVLPCLDPPLPARLRLAVPSCPDVLPDPSLVLWLALALSSLLKAVPSRPACPSSSDVLVVLPSPSRCSPDLPPAPVPRPPARPDVAPTKSVRRLLLPPLLIPTTRPLVNRMVGACGWDRERRIFWLCTAKFRLANGSLGEPEGGTERAGSGARAHDLFCAAVRSAPPCHRQLQQPGRRPGMRQVRRRDDKVIINRDKDVVVRGPQSADRPGGVAAEVERYVGRHELAALMGVNVRTVDRMVRAGMPSENWGLRARRFRPSEALAWARARGADADEEHEAA